MSRLTILMYHIIDNSRDPREAQYCCPPARFEAQMRHLHESGVPVHTLDDLSRFLRGEGAWPDNGVIVTFDDGFGDFYHNALPVLRRYAIPATLFVVTGRVGDSNEWMHRNGYPRRALLNWEQLAEAREGGVCLGTHTRTHPKLSEIPLQQAREELAGSKAELEAFTGAPVEHFAYPHGMYNPEVRELVAETGYRTACSTRSGFNRSDVDPCQLRRIEVYGNDSLWQFRQKLRFGSNHMPWYYPARYYLGRLTQRLRSAASR